MLMIRNGKIMLTRGDSAYITVTLKAQDGAAYTMQAGDKLTLTFDDLVLDVGTLSPRVSALSCVPLVLQNFPKVYLDSLGAETLGDVDTLRADFSLTLSGETLACSLWLDASGAPVYAEIAENDKIIAAAEFTNFIFGDILSPDAAQ